MCGSQFQVTLTETGASELLCGGAEFLHPNLTVSQNIAFKSSLAA
jgi:hypothetical protein